MQLRFPRKQSGALFVHPLDPAPKTVVLVDGFRSTRAVRVFPGGWSEEAARLFPCALAAPLPELRRLARTGIELNHAVIVLTKGTEPCLKDDDRDLLWGAFGVPAFEQCLGTDNQLLAAECEAHDGLHVVAGRRQQPLETAVCGCGSSIPRLMPALREMPALRKMPASETSELERIYSLVS